MHVNKKRLLVLFLLNILIAIHIILWYRLNYQKVGTFSLNGIVSLFGIGLLNSAAAFFILVVLITIFSGRLFCGWGCHFAFFQEFALKILNKFRINPQIIHSKANIIQYVFLLKTLTAVYEFWFIYGLPQFHVSFGDTQVMTVDLPRSPIIITLFILFDAFLFIYLLGSRAFCRYVCPWAPILALFDNISPLRIRKIGECEGCMTCTRNCTMGIQVHSEIAQYGAVVDTNCIRCLTCKDACPNGTLGYKWGPNVISITRKIKWLIPKKSNYCWYYELILIFCGLIVAYFTQMWLGSFQTFLGAAWGLCFGMLIIRLLKSKSISLKEITLYREKFLIVSLVTLCTLAWCWITNTPHDTRLLLRGNRFMDLMEYDKAISIYNQTLNKSPSNNEIRATLALAYKTKGDYNRSITEYKILINNNPDNAALHNNLGTVYYRKGDYDLAIEEYKKSTQLDTHLTAAYGNIGLIFLEKGNIEESIPYLRKVFQNEDEMLKYIFRFYKPKQDLKG